MTQVLSEAERAHVEACRRHLEDGAEIRTLSGQKALLAIIDRLSSGGAAGSDYERFADFVNLWCNRDGKISDGERLSVIKYHPIAQARLRKTGFPSEAQPNANAVSPSYEQQGTGYDSGAAGYELQGRATKMEKPGG